MRKRSQGNKRHNVRNVNSDKHHKAHKRQNRQRIKATNVISDNIIMRETHLRHN